MRRDRNSFVGPEVIVVVRHNGKLLGWHFDPAAEVEVDYITDGEADPRRPRETVMAIVGKSLQLGRIDPGLFPFDKVVHRRPEALEYGEELTLELGDGEASQ